MRQPRDYSIDFFKGVTVISIVFIHTVWWSGQQYVPNIIAQFSLLIDVPLFFFLSGAGATFAFQKRNPFSGILRLIALFAIFYGLFALLVNPKLCFELFFKSIFLQFSPTPQVPVVFGSVWFIPVFVVVYIIGYIVINHIGNKNMLILICLSLLILIFTYDKYPFLKSLNLFNIRLDFVFTYLFFFLFGYYYKNSLTLSKTNLYFYFVLLFLCFSLTIYHFWNISFDLQNLKFPPRFYYVVSSLISVSLVMLLSSHIKREYLINFIGKNALEFYLSQGLASSLIYFVCPTLRLEWPFKLFIVFSMNLTITFIIALITI